VEVGRFCPPSLASRLRPPWTSTEMFSRCPAHGGPATNWIIGEAASSGPDTLDHIVRAKCPHCGAVHTFPGFKHVTVYTCEECGEEVRVPPPEGN
jgi:hypothetical protein